MTGELKDIAIDKIHRTVKLRDRCSRDNLKSLRETMREHGQLCPVLVTSPSPDGRYGLLDGMRRVLSAKDNGETTISAVVLDEGVSEVEAIEKAFVSNSQREELNPIARANAVAMHIAAAGSNASQSAARLGLDASIGSKLVQLLRLPMTIQEQIANGSIPWTAGYQLTLIEDSARQTELAAKVANKQLTRDELSAEVASQKKGRQKPKRKAEKKVIFILASGDSVVVTAREPSLDVLAQYLEEALEKLRQIKASGGGLDQLKRRCREEGKASRPA